MENFSSQNGKIEAEDKYSSVLYVADLPKETTNEDLQNIFKDYHFLYASLNNTKNNQTFAQVYIENKDWATKARHELNGYIIKPMNGANNTKEGKPMRICKYEGKGHQVQNNIKQSLLVKNIDNKMTQTEFYKIFLEYGDIVSGKIEYDESGKSKGFGYIYYYEEESAEKAKKNINGKKFYDKALEIVNLIPGKKIKNNDITLFVLNIPFNITDKELTTIFERFGPVSYISVSKKGFAYVSFNSFDNAIKCLRKMKEEPFAFPGMPNMVVKPASSKEERNSNKNFIKNHNDNYFGNSNLNVQFNCIYLNHEVKTEIELEKEIRFFIKVVMFTDFNPKEVLVDFETMSGLVTFQTYKDYNIFFKKYQEYCLKQNPYFECIPYIPQIKNEEEKIKEDEINIINNTPKPLKEESKEKIKELYDEKKQKNFYREQIPSNEENNYEITPEENDKDFNQYNQNKPYKQNQNAKKNSRYYNNQNNNNYYNNYKYNNKNNKKQNYNNNYYNNGNKRYNQNNNKNNTNHYNKKYIFRPGDNYDLTNMKTSVGMFGPNNGNPNNKKQNIVNDPKNRQEVKTDNIYYNGQNKNEKKEIEVIDERNLQSLNPKQLYSQFNHPPIPKMINSEEQEEIKMEIADSIYEIVYNKYPDEAGKITGMIKETGLENMNMLLSKKEELDDVIEQAYDMIMNNNNK